MQKKIDIDMVKKIKVILTDVDGVLTDGSRYFDEKGECFKKFNVLDGMGINILLKNGINTYIVTKENSKIVKKWAKEMNISKVFMGIKTKEDIIKKICKNADFKPKEIAYIGDDVNDLELLKLVGLSACPSNGIDLIKKECKFVCKKSGGNGAFRELADFILSKKFPKKTKWY